MAGEGLGGEDAAGTGTEAGGDPVIWELEAEYAPIVDLVGAHQDVAFGAKGVFRRRIAAHGHVHVGLEYRPGGKRVRRIVLDVPLRPDVPGRGVVRQPRLADGVAQHHIARASGDIAKKRSIGHVYGLHGAATAHLGVEGHPDPECLGPPIDVRGGRHEVNPASEGERAGRRQYGAIAQCDPARLPVQRPKERVSRRGPFEDRGEEGLRHAFSVVGAALPWYEGSVHEIWTDGEHWYAGRAESLAVGPVAIANLAGEVRTVSPEALARARIAESEAVARLRAALPVSPAAVVGSLITAFQELFDLRSGVKGIREVYGIGVRANPNEVASLRERVAAIAAHLTGPGAEIACATLREFPDRLVAEIAARAPTVEVETPGGPSAEVAAAVALLTKIAGKARSEAVSLTDVLLRPEPEDIDRVFAPPVREMARRYYAAFWDEGPAPLARPGQTRLRVVAASVPMLRGGNVRDFPGGYSEIAGQLAPGPTWYCWDWVGPGQTAGTAFDGLVQIADWWAWFPKPWRILR